jgi:hypothetical protein
MTQRDTCRRVDKDSVGVGAAVAQRPCHRADARRERLPRRERD